MQGIKLKEYSLGYRDIPKVACTSIKLALYKMMTGKDFLIKEHGKHIHEYFNKFYEDISEVDFKFIVIRDPIKRFLSAYSNRVLFHKELSKEYLLKIENGKKILNEGRVPITPNLSDFIKYLDIYRTVPTINHHIKPITQIFNESLDYFDKVYKIEELSKLENDLSNKYKVNFQLPHEQRGGKKFKVSDLSKKELEYLLEYYSKDYELLKDYYNKDNIIKEWSYYK